MPTYQLCFHDSGDGGREPLVEERQFADFSQARDEAIRELSFMALSRLPGGDHRVFSVTVMNADGDMLYEGEMVFRAQHGKHPS